MYDGALDKVRSRAFADANIGISFHHLGVIAGGQYEVFYGFLCLVEVSDNINAPLIKESWHDIWTCGGMDHTSILLTLMVVVYLCFALFKHRGPVVPNS